MEEDKQSVEFYKIKLMQKQSELKTIEAKFKKIQFKHSRDLKEIKIAEERAKDLLKKEKLKLDKITKQAKQHQELNTLLQHRLTELKEEKDKEIQNTRNKYNAIKQQVRSYQRILPTHTFLTEIGAQIEQLPTYEDIFNNLKQKTLSYDNLSSKHEQHKTQMQQKISTMQKNQEQLTNKISQKQKHVKEILPRVIQMEGQVNQYKTQLQDAASKIIETEEEMMNLKQRIQEMQNQNKQLKNQIEEIIQAHNNELHSKELQLKDLTQSEFKRYEQQISQLNVRSDMKEQTFLRQINIYEEEVLELQNRLAKQKERHEENYQQIKQMMQNLKSTLQNDKRTIHGLQNKNEELTKNLIQSGCALENLQLKLRQLIHQKQETEGRLKQERSQRDLNHTQLTEKDIQKRELEEKVQQYLNELAKLTEEKRLRDQQNLILINQLEELRYKANNGSAILQSGFQFPPNLEQDQELNRRRKSTNFSINEETHFTYVQGSRNQLKLELQPIQNRSRKASLAVSERFNEIKSLKAHNEQLQTDLAKKSDQLKQLQQKTSKHEQKVTILELQISKAKQLTSEHLNLLKQVEQKQVKRREQIQELNKVIKELQIQTQDLKSNQSTLKKKHETSKTAIQTLNTEVATLKADLKKQKQNKQSLTLELKQIKTKQFQQISSSEKGTKQLTQKIKELNTKISNEQKTKNQLINRQKAYQLQITTVKAQIQKLTTKSIQFQKKITEKDQKLQQMLKNNKQLKKNNQRLKYEVNQLEDENKQRDRQIEMINDSLQRQRKQRTLITVPSLQSLQADQEYQEEQNFKEHYNTIGQKQGQIYMLERQISNLKEELEELKITYKSKTEDLENEQNEYIQQIIIMKVKVAESEMRAAQKEHLYNQLKKKVIMAQKNLKQTSSPSLAK